MLNIVNFIKNKEATRKVPSTIEALQDGTKLSTLQKISSNTIEGISDRLSYLEEKTFKLDQDKIEKFQDSRSLPGIGDVFDTVPQEFEEPVFQLLKKFAESYIDKSANSIPLDEIDFSSINDLSDLNSDFFKYIKELDGENKIDAAFNELSVWKDGIDTWREKTDTMIDLLNKRIIIQSTPISAISVNIKTISANIENLRYNMKKDYLRKTEFTAKQNELIDKMNAMYFDKDTGSVPKLRKAVSDLIKNLDYLEGVLKDKDTTNLPLQLESQDQTQVDSIPDLSIPKIKSIGDLQYMTRIPDSILEI